MQQLAIEAQKHQFDSIHALIEKEYTIERDSFSKGIPEIVVPKNKPSSFNIDYIWAYMVINQGKAEYFRLVIQTSQEKKIDGVARFTFNIDDKISDIFIQSYMAHESYNGNYYEIPSGYAVDFLKSIKIGSKVKMKISNWETYTTRNVTSKEINNIVKTYKYYRELGGELEAPDLIDE
ncbi:hypothetical protein [Hoylesella marshii]|uniref:Uncharacterized protein n=1 Tax=Hoylesella marshii DSM 16973 = JCM 13450 TaxID=862515 RepID=E0NST1_9BACT|nr:hypothetical protein [Hoylesella marshii]EFM01795.1 hypothetical protein HMPREF0658_1283 [Hoylesella marshii DSM 16973 = JCM 13450]